MFNFQILESPKCALDKRIPQSEQLSPKSTPGVFKMRNCHQNQWFYCFNIKFQEGGSTVMGRGFRVLPLYTIVWRVHRRYVVLFEITVQA